MLPENRNLPPLERHSPLDRILHHNLFAAGLLLLSAAAAFIIANTHVSVGAFTLAGLYKNLWSVEFGLSVLDVEVTKPLHLWINDGLMAIFFFVVGLEIKRELVVGELASVRKAMLPIAAAVGGMMAPALVYSLINLGGEGAHGWGIPMATDIAFSAGVLGLLSKRIPRALPVFLVALAIVDDLGAVVVIALFYTERVAIEPLIAGAVLIALSFALARVGVRSAVVFLLLAICIWLAFVNSGVHATIAGVLLALTVPVDARYNSVLFAGRIKELVTPIDEEGES